MFKQTLIISYPMSSFFNTLSEHLFFYDEPDFFDLRHVNAVNHDSDK